VTIDDTHDDIRDDTHAGLISRRLFVGGALATLTPGWAMAQGRTDSESTNILRQLAPQDRLPQISGQRGGGAGAARPAPRRPARRVVTVIIRERGIVEEIRVDLSRRVEITVFFDNDSTDLRFSAVRSLNALAVALQDPILADQNFLIAGHTNTVGARDYNVTLSAGRALSVRDWLISAGGVTSNRLYWHGFGPDMLRSPSNPTSPVNRRVEIIALDA
jgi:outer membrane protein OmpA-like peptidoglycan-associated protein